MSNKIKIAQLIKDNQNAEITPAVMRDALDIIDIEQMTISRMELEAANPLVQLKVLPTGHAAQMQVIYNGQDVASMEWLKDTNDFILNISDQNTGVSKNTLELKTDGNLYIRGKLMINKEQIIEMIRGFRHTVVMNTKDHNKATRLESIQAFKQLPFYDWKEDDAFYIKDTTGHKMISMKYFADGAIDESTAGRFFYRAMSQAQ